MSILAFLLLGLIAGFLGSKIVAGSGQGILGDVIVGVIGALIGGLLFNFFGAHGVTGLNLYSIFVATAGSVLLLAVYYAVRNRESSA